jgi:hypothetical protein
MQVVNLQPVTILTTSDPDQQVIVNAIESSDGSSEGSVGIHFDGGGSEPARSRGIGDWED